MAAQASGAQVRVAAQVRYSFRGAACWGDGAGEGWLRGASVLRGGTR